MEIYIHERCLSKGCVTLNIYDLSIDFEDEVS